MSIIDNFYTEWKDKIEKIINEEGLELIDTKLAFCSGDYMLRCIVDYEHGGITIDNCAMLNKKIIRFLEESSALGADFIVEVNSPGLDRALKTYKDFARMKGKMVGIWPKAPLDGKMYFEGIISGVSEQSVTLDIKGKDYIIDFVNINVGKEMIEADIRGSKRG
ncbi:MAG: hypothetical protein WC412_02915 [Candidatus Omnitrophota bacterium]|jgi:ribosome maturation factor RimP